MYPMYDILELTTYRQTNRCTTDVTKHRVYSRIGIVHVHKDSLTILYLLRADIVCRACLNPHMNDETLPAPLMNSLTPMHVIEQSACPVTVLAVIGIAPIIWFLKIKGRGKPSSENSEFIGSCRCHKDYIFSISLIRAQRSIRSRAL